MVCPCLVPLIDSRVYKKDPLILFPNEWDDITNVTIREVTEKGKKWMMVLYRKPVNKDAMKEYKVNGHFVYAGCANISENKLKCEKSLFYVLHPISEWREFHELK